jgi:hypothetical protein
MKTIGELYGPASEVFTEDDADVYFEEVCDYIMTAYVDSASITRAEAAEIARSNIGYMAGYYDKPVRDRMFKLFKCEHPVFGTTEPSPQEAFEAGQRLGKVMMRDKKL